MIELGEQLGYRRETALQHRFPVPVFHFRPKLTHPVTGWVSFGRKWKTGTGKRYFADIIGLFSATVT